MKNNDFEFISSKFEEENVKAPESLSAERITERFDSKSVSNIVKIKKNKRGFKAVVAAAACFAIVITGVAVGGRSIKPPVEPENPPANNAPQVQLEGIKYFSSYDELEKTLDELKPEEDGVIEKGIGIIGRNFEKSGKYRSLKNNV